MTIEEIKEKFVPKRCSSQKEFDQFMCELGDQQTLENHPYLDKFTEIAQKRSVIRQKICELSAEDEMLKQEHLACEKEKKDKNRVFHELKHELIGLNPKGCWDIQH